MSVLGEVEVSLGGRGYGTSSVRWSGVAFRVPAIRMHRSIPKNLGVISTVSVELLSFPGMMLQ